MSTEHHYVPELPDYGYDYENYPVSLGFPFSVKESIPRITSYPYYENVAKGAVAETPPHARYTTNNNESYNFPMPPSLPGPPVSDLSSRPLPTTSRSHPQPMIARAATVEYEMNPPAQFIDSANINELQRNPLPEIYQAPPENQLRHPRDQMLEKYPPGTGLVLGSLRHHEHEQKTNIRPDIDAITRSESRPTTASLTSPISRTSTSTDNSTRLATMRIDSLTTLLLKSDQAPRHAPIEVRPEDRRICQYNISHAAVDVQLEHFDEAEQLLREASEIMGGYSPELVGFYAFRVASEIEGSNPVAVEAWLRKLIQYHGSSTARLHQLSMAQAKQGKDQEAIMTAQYINRMTPEIHLHVADLQAKIKHFNDAKLHAEKAVEATKGGVGPKDVYVRSLEVMVSVCEELNVPCGPYRRMLAEANRAIMVQNFKVVDEDEDMVFVDNGTALGNLFRLRPKQTVVRRKKSVMTVPAPVDDGASGRSKKAFWKR